MSETRKEFETALKRHLGDSYDTLVSIAKAMIEAGGRCQAVGGAVRDFLMGVPIKDLDVEVFGLPLSKAEKVLGSFGSLIKIGKSFGVLKIRGLDIDFSLPRRDSKSGEGHRGFVVAFDPCMSSADAARRRDLTINAIAIDLDTGDLVDPAGGRADIKKRLLRATDPETFLDDPLRVYRVAQFAARFRFDIDPGTVKLSASMTPEGLPRERIFGEFEKLLLRGKKPSLGLEFLRACGWIRYFPELEAIIGVPQDPEWHPEGDVWTHTNQALDEAVKYRSGDWLRDLKLMFAVLCHDMGKAVVTREERGRLRSPKHEPEGAGLAETFMTRLTGQQELIDGVVILVGEHLKPAMLARGEMSLRAVRRLSIRMAPTADIRLLVQVAKADHLSRPGFDSFPAGEKLLKMAEELAIQDSAEKPVLMGRHLLAAGVKPGPGMGILLARAFDIQVSEGIRDAKILGRRVLGEWKKGVEYSSEGDTPEGAASPGSVPDGKEPPGNDASSGGGGRSGGQ